MTSVSNTYRVSVGVSPETAFDYVADMARPRMSQSLGALKKQLESRQG